MNINQWADDYLTSHGYTVLTQPENVLTTPWSSVSRISTTSGIIYLKKMPPALSLEPLIAQILHDRFHANVPVVIASNKELNCFLMNDCGHTLREIFKNQFQPAILCQGIKDYTFMQRATINHADLFLELGVPDWRLNKLPLFYEKFINKESLLLEDGISTEELSLLQKLQPKFLSQCKILSEYKVPETLDHCDFHDNNILFDENTHKTTIIDLGETVITHPFFSLITCVGKATTFYALKVTDKAYLDLQAACFENWLEFENKTNLLEIFSITSKLRPFYSVLGEYRLMQSTDEATFKSLNRRGRLTRYFKELIAYNTK